jgi:uncharacterized protein YbaP (TraB family)
MKEKAIQKLIESGMTEREAISEFNDTVNYYLIGTLHTAADRVYATKCAIDDILDDSEEVEEITEHYQAMLGMMYS